MQMRFNGLQQHLVSRKQLLAALAVGAIMLATAAIRLRMVNAVLDRDEGECAYAGQLILQGEPPYLHIYNMKLPGTYYAFAAIMALFRQTPAGIHFGLLLVNAITIFTVFLLGRRLADDFAGIAAAAIYALLSLDSSVDGYHADMSHFLLLFAVPGVLCLLEWYRRESKPMLWASGLLLGLGYLMKQHGAAFVLFGLFIVIVQAFEQRPFDLRKLFIRLLTYVTAAATPYMLLCLLMYRQGVFRRFWFWTVSYASQYVSETTMADAWTYLKYAVSVVFLGGTVTVWILVLIAGIVLLLYQENRSVRMCVSSWLAFSALAVLPGLYFWPHYFVFTFPAVAVATGMGLSVLRHKLQPRGWLPASVPVVLCLAAVGTTLYRERDYFFRYSPVQGVRMEYGGNPFPEAVEIARYIHEHSVAGDRVAVFGSEPEIYFYAQRLSASGYIHMYGLNENQKYSRKMLQEFTSETKAANPKYVVLVTIYASWWILPPHNSSMADLQAWLGEFLKGYRVVGLANVVSRQQTDYFWGSQAAQAKPAGSSIILLEKT